MPDTPVEAFINLVQETVASLRNQPRLVSPAVIDDLDVFCKKRLIPICIREQKSFRNPYVLSLIGLTNVGKSTLMEALLGFPVAPRKTGPATAIPVEYKYSDNWSIKVLYRASKRSPENFIFSDAHSLGRELAIKVVDVSDVQASEIAWVTVCGPMEMLVHGLNMADTPGFGAAQVGDDDGSHQRRLEDFISKRVDRVYFCVAAGTAWAVSDIEKEFYIKISHLCGHVIITKWEGTPAEEIDYRKRYQHLFPGAEILFVNAKRAIRNTNQSLDIEKLKEIVAGYSTPESRRAMCDPELSLAWHEINEHMDIVHNLTHIPWRIDLLRQFYESCHGPPSLNKLCNDLKIIINGFNK